MIFFGIRDRYHDICLTVERGSCMENRSASWGITLLRIAIAVVFLVHGGQKLFVFGIPGVTGFFTQIGVPLPSLFAPVISVVEFFGGLALLLGIGTRYAALCLALDMLGAIIFVHGKNGFFVPSGVEFVFVLLAANIALGLAGPGALALEPVLFRRAGTVFEYTLK